MVKNTGTVRLSGKQVPPTRPAPRKPIAMKQPRVPVVRRVQPGGAGERALNLEQQKALVRRVRENLMKKDTYEIRRCEEVRYCDRLPSGRPCDYCESFSKPMLEFRFSWEGIDHTGRPYDETDDLWLHNDAADAPEAKDAFWLSLAGVDYNDGAAVAAYLSGERFRPPVGHVPAPWAPRPDAVPNAIGAWANHGPPAGHVAPVMPAEDDPDVEIVIRFLRPNGAPFRCLDGQPLPSIVLRSDMVASMRMSFRNGSRGKGRTTKDLLSLYRYQDFARGEDLPKKIPNIINKAIRGPVFGEVAAQPAVAAVAVGGGGGGEQPVGQDPVAEELAEGADAVVAEPAGGAEQLGGVPEVDGREAFVRAFERRMGLA